MRAPCGRGGVEDVVDRGGGRGAELCKLDSVPVEKLESLEDATGRLLAMTERSSAVHRPEGHFGVDFVTSCIGACKPRDVKNATPQRVGLRGYPETRSEGHLQKLPRGSCKDGARGSGEEAASGDVRLAWSEPDGDVDGHDAGIGQLLEGRFDFLDEVIRGEAAVVEDDRDPAAPRAVDAADSHGGRVWPSLPGRRQP